MASDRSLNVIFDLGGVLIDWNPRYLYRQLFDGDEAGMEHFLVEICSPPRSKITFNERSLAIHRLRHHCAAMRN